MVQIMVSKEHLKKLFDEHAREFDAAVGDRSYYNAMIERLKSRYRGSFIAFGVFSQEAFHNTNELNIKAHIFNIALNDAIVNKKGINAAIGETLEGGGYEVAVDAIETQLKLTFDEIYGSDQIHEDEIEED